MLVEDTLLLPPFFEEAHDLAEFLRQVTVRAYTGVMVYGPAQAVLFREAVGLLGLSPGHWHLTVLPLRAWRDDHLLPWYRSS